MACKNFELISAINSFGAASSTSDRNLIVFSGNLIGQLIETLEFDPEEPPEVKQAQEEDAGSASV